MRKVLSFSLFLMLGLVASQLLPGALGTAYPGFKATADTLLYICLGFIMINVGREFEIDKSRWRSYTADYFIAMATAALPWLLIVLYYIFVLLPSDLWTDSAAWKENLLLSRFAAPTSAGILFTMLAALSLKNSWIYRKIQVLAIFDDLDTILLMIPLIFIGVVLGLAVTGKVFNFFSLLGLLGLVGMNIKNAVVLVEQIGVLRAAGKDPYEALTSATRSRIVPVAMASGTTILGMLPLAIGTGAGSETWQPMGIAVIGGLTFSTILTLFIVPVLYSILVNRSQRKEREKLARLSAEHQASKH